MGINGRGLSVVALLWLAGAAGAAPQHDTTHPGELVYQRSCAMCHDHGEALRAPTLATLKGMRYQQIYFALTVGKMQAQGRALSATERSELIDYLIGRARVSDAWTAQLRCTAGRRKVDLSMPATVADFGFDLKNHRHLTAAAGGHHDR
jgi:mono/diheme cytochrome c family protein